MRAELTIAPSGSAPRGAIISLHRAGGPPLAARSVVLSLAEPELGIQPIKTDAERTELATKGWFEEKSEYLSEPNRWSQAFLDDGRNNRVLNGIIHTHCPVHILQGQKDEDVPFTHALKLVAHLPADQVTLTLVPDGDHRLSRQQDLTLLETTVLSMLKSVKVS